MRSPREKAQFSDIQLWRDPCVRASCVRDFLINASRVTIASPRFDSLPSFGESLPVFLAPSLLRASRELNSLRYTADIPPADSHRRVLLFTSQTRASMCGLCQTRSCLRTANMGCWPDTGLMLGRRLRRWPSIKPTLVQYFVFAVCTVSRRCFQMLNSNTGNFHNNYFSHKKTYT